MKSHTDQDVTAHIRCSGPLTWWLDGKQVFQADRPGAHSFPLRLTKGSHVCATRIVSGDKEWFLAGHIAPAGPAPIVEARCRFDVPRTDELVSLTLVGPRPEGTRLNDKPFPLPLPGMRYERIGSAPATCLAIGRNVLSRTLSLAEARRIAAKPRVALFAHRADEARILSGPVLTDVGKTAATVVCYADARVPATLRLGGREFASPASVVHRWRVDELQPATAYPFSLTVGQGETRRGVLRTMPAGTRATIALAGDPQSGGTWSKVAASVAKARPDVVVLAGDLVVDGLSEASWARTFFSPPPICWRTSPAWRSGATTTGSRRCSSSSSGDAAQANTGPDRSEAPCWSASTVARIGPRPDPTPSGSMPPWRARRAHSCSW